MPGKSRTGADGTLRRTARPRRRPKSPPPSDLSASKLGIRSERLVFDALEPRVLLNADVLAVQLATMPNDTAAHDVLVQMVNQAVQVGTQTQMVQRVQVLDAAHGNAVLAFGDLATIKQISIQGAAGPDHITINADSFGAHTIPAISVAAGSDTAHNTLAIVHGKTTVLLDWQVNGNGSGTVTAETTANPLTVSFTGVGKLVGGAGNDVLHGPAPNTTWNVTGTGAGKLTPAATGAVATHFSGFERLVGAANNQDHFNIAPAAGMPGGIDGGAGGFDSVTVNGGTAAAVVLRATGSSSGSIGIGANTIAYTGMEPIDVGTVGQSTTVDLTGAQGTVTLADGPQAGTLVITDPGHAESQTIAAPTQSLTIDLGSGGGNTLTVDTVNNLATAFTVQTEGAKDVVNVAAPIVSQGGTVSLTADTVNIIGTGTIDTRLAGGTSGDIDLNGTAVVLDQNSLLRTDAAPQPGSSAGNVSITTTNTVYNTPILPVDFTARSVAISMFGGTILAGNVSLSATAADQSLVDEAPDYTTGLIGNLTGLLQQIPGDVISAATGLDGSIVDRGANASILVQGATIVGSGAVSISATTAVDAISNAVVEGADGAASITKLQVAVGYAQAASTVTTALTDNAYVSGDQGVSIASTGGVSASTTSYAATNPTASQSSPNPNAVQLAIAVTWANLTDTTKLDDTVTVASSAGNVSIGATGSTSSIPSAQTTGFDNGRAGVNLGLSFDTATVETDVNGHVSAAGSINLAQGGSTSNNTLTFNGGNANDVNLADSTLFLQNHGLTTGDQVTYTAQNAVGPLTAVASTAIGGLSSGQTYYVLVVDKDHIQLANAPPIVLDPATTDPAASHTLTIPGAYDFTLNAIDSTANTISIQQNGFKTGDTVTYNANGNTPIHGLTSGASYIVASIDGNTFSLKDPTTNAIVAVSQGTATGAQTFTDGSDVQIINLALIDPTANTITAAGNPFTDGESVVYTPLTSTDLSSSVNNGLRYTVNVVSPGVFRLLDPSANSVIPLTTPAGPSLFELDYAASVISFKPSSDVNAVTDEITVPSTAALTNGEAVLYNVDPTITRSVTVQGDAFPGQTFTVTEPDAPIGGLVDNGVYYVVVVDPTHIRLAKNASYALNATPITFTSLGSGNDNTLSVYPSTVGIGLSSTLTSTDDALAMPTTGQTGRAAGAAFALASNDSLNSLGLSFGSFIASKLPSPTDTSGGNNNALTSSVNAPSDSNGFTAAGAIAFIYVDHTVKTLVGNLATAQAPTVLTTPGNVTVVASITETEQILSQAYASKPDGSNGSAFVAAISVGLYTNTAVATIEGNSQVDAGSSLSVSSNVSYPILGTPLGILESIPQGFVDNGVSELATVFDGTFGLGSGLLNTWDESQASPTADGATSFNGSVAVNVFNNNATALIDSGARINQTISLQNANQSVAVTANVLMTMVDLVGNGTLFLSPAGVLGAIQKASGVADALKGGYLIDAFGRSSGRSVGGSVLVADLNDNTTAEIGDGAQVHVGSSGTLDVAAAETVFRVDIVEAGALVTSGGSLAFAGSGLGLRERSNTYAGILSGATITGGGTLDISATVGQPQSVDTSVGTIASMTAIPGFDLGIAGGIAASEGGATNFGVAVAVNDIVHNTDAFIGADPSVSATTTPTDASSINVGTLDITASTTGLLISLGVAGSVNKSPSSTPAGSGTSADPNASANDPASATPLPALDSQDSTTPTTAQSTSGIGIAGSALVNIIDDTNLAYVNTPGTITAISLTGTATNNQTEALVSGAIAITVNNENDSQKDIGGAFAWNQITDDTESFAKGGTIDIVGAPAPGTTTLSLTATRQGTLVALTAAVAADTNANGKDFAGSMSVNRILDTTNALIDSETVGNANGVALDAENDANMIAIGGGATFTRGGTGVGASIGFNQIAVPTEAGVLGSSATSRLQVGSLTATAENNAIISAVGVSAGVATGSSSGGAGGAFTIGVNIISTANGIFPTSPSAAVTATLSNADITAAGTVALKADDNSVIQSIAGAIGFATQSSAFGVGLSWNEVALNINAIVTASTITAGSVSLLSESTQNAGLVNGKIATAAVSGAVSTSGNVAVGASVSINGVQNTIDSEIESGSTVIATSGDIDVTATDNATIYDLVGAVAIAADGSGFGAAVGANYIANTVTAEIADAEAESEAGNVSVVTSESGDIEAVTVGLTGADSTAIGGSVSIAVITDTTTADIGNTTASPTTVTAANAVTVRATNDATIGTVAGQLAISGGGTAIGASIATAVVVNHNNAYISGLATVTGLSGITIDAETSQNLTIFAIAGSGADGVGIGGSATVTVLDDTTQAYVGAVGNGQTAGLISTGATGSSDVEIKANSTMILLGTAGALSFGGSVGVGVGADVGVATRRTYAFIGAGARVKATGNIVVSATANEQILSISATGAGAGDVAVGVSAGVSVLNLTTYAYVDAGAVITANDNVLISAQDITSVTQVGGDLAIGGDVAVGIAATIGTINKNTDSWIAAQAIVTAHAQGNAIHANTGQFIGGSGSDAQGTAPAAETFQTSALNTATNQITITGNGLLTGDEVVYGDQHEALGGLQSGVIYFVIVNAQHPDQIQLARTYQDALNGNAIALSDGLAAQSDFHSIQKITNIGVPTISTPAFNGASNGTQITPFGAPATAARQGVVVVAVSGNTVESAGVTAGGAGAVAVNVAAAVAVDTLNTEAHIDSGATVVATGNTAVADPAVYVDSGRTWFDLAIGGGANVSAGGAVLPAVSAPVLEGTTEALITGATVTAAGDVEVRAVAQEFVISVAVGISVSGAAFAGSAAVVSIGTANDPTQTIAEIAGGASVAAGGNVLVLANDQTTDYAIAGAVGIGFDSAAGGAAVALSLLYKDVTSVIDASTVTGAATANTPQLTGVLSGRVDPNAATFSQETIGGVAVQAESGETVFDVAGAGAGGFYVGLAGGVSVEDLNVNVQAAIQDDASVGSANGSVAVGADDKVKEFAVAGALGLGIGGLGAGVDVNILRNNTQAFISGGTVVASTGTVEVSAQTLRNIQTYADALGAGGIGLGGGIAVLSIGGNFSSNYSANGHAGDALATGTVTSNGTVTTEPSIGASVDSEVASALGGTLSGGGNSLPAINPHADVVGNEIDFHQATNLHTGDAITYNAEGSTPIGGLFDGQTYFVIVDPANPDRISLAATFADANAGHAITLSVTASTGSSQLFVAGSSGIQSDAQTQDSGALPSNSPIGASTGNKSSVASGTTASIDNGASIVAANVDVQASQAMTINVEGGGAGIGLGAALGVGVAVITVQSDVSAYIGTATITGGGPGSVTIAATRNSTIDAIGLEGAASGFLSLGGAVAIVSDTSAVSALLGGEPIEGGGYDAASGITRVDGFSSITVNGTQAAGIGVATWAFTLSGEAAIGAAITLITDTPDTTAAIGPNAEIGTHSTIGSVSVSATQIITVGGYPFGIPNFSPSNDIAIGATAAGIFAGTATYSNVSLGGETQAEIGNSATVLATGAVTVNADDDIEAASLRVDGGAIAAVAIGVMFGTAQLTPTVESRVGKQAVIHGGSIAVTGTNTSNVSLTVAPAAGGIGAGTGGIVSGTGTITTGATIDQGAMLLSSGNITLDSEADPKLTVDAEGHDMAVWSLGSRRRRST